MRVNGHEHMARRVAYPVLAAGAVATIGTRRRTTRSAGRRYTVTILLSLLVLPTTAAFGWGDAGHHIVAMIAMKRLAQPLKDKIDAILQDEDPCDHDGSATLKTTCAATWADWSRNNTHTATYNWHFVDIKLSHPTYDAAHDCAPTNQATKGKCGLYGLDHSLKILRNETTDPKITRAQALMFVMHVVGDLHQPLHTVKDGGGGNAHKVEYFDVSTDMHKVWDTKILESRMLQLHESEEQYAEVLGGDVDASFEQGEPVDWLNATHTIAIEDAYGWRDKSKKTSDGRPWLRSAYYKHNWPIVDRQLQRGGARLAKILTDALQ